MVEVDHYLGSFIGGKGFGPLYFVFKLIENVTPLKTATTGIESWSERLRGDWLRPGEQHHAGGRGGRRDH